MKNVLKMTSAAVLALFATTEISQAHNFKSGFVAGGAVGYSKMNTKTTSSNKSSNKFAGFATRFGSSSTRANKSSSSITGDIFSGYRYITESGFAVGFNLGFGLDGNSTKNSGTFTNVNTTTFQTKLNRQFQIKPAIFLGKTIGNNWMIFTELGMSISRFKLKSTIQETSNTNLTQNKTTSFTKVGFAPALGAEFAVNKNLSVQGTLSYEFFGSTKKDLGSTDGTVLVTRTQTENSVKVKPRYFTMKIGAVYKF